MVASALQSFTIGVLCHMLEYMHAHIPAKDYYKSFTYSSTWHFNLFPFLLASAGYAMTHGDVLYLQGLAFPS
jgi:hypothetical protein